MAAAAMAAAARAHLERAQALLGRAWVVGEGNAPIGAQKLAVRRCPLLMSLSIEGL